MVPDALSRYTKENVSSVDRSKLLRPMTSKEILDMSVRLNQLFGPIFIRYALLPGVFCAFSVYFTFAFLLEKIFTSNTNDFWGQLNDFAFSIGIGLFVAVPLFVLGATIIGVTVSHVVSSWMQGAEPSEQSVSAALKRCTVKSFWTSILIAIIGNSGFLVSAACFVASAILTKLDNSNSESWIIGALIFFGFAMIPVGLVIAAVVFNRILLGVSVSVNEEVYGWKAYKRAGVLMKKLKIGRLLDAPGEVLVKLGLASLGISGLVLLGLVSVWGSLGGDKLVLTLTKSIPFADVLVVAAQILPIYMVVVFLLPLISCAASVLYTERRVRLEGYDILLTFLENQRDKKKNRFNV